MSIIWNTIHQNFKDCIEDSVTGVNSLTSISVSYSESEDAVNLSTLPASIFNGKYSIQLDNINAVREDIATGVCDFDYNVKVQVAFEINSQEKSTYHTAIGDLEELIRKRLDYDSWKNTAIVNIELVVGNKADFIPIETLERFLVLELVFRTVGRTNLNA